MKKPRSVFIRERLLEDQTRYENWAAGGLIGPEFLAHLSERVDAFRKLASDGADRNQRIVARLWNDHPDYSEE